MPASLSLISGLRQAVPYINALAERPLVILFDGDVLEDAERLAPLIHDIALLDSLGIRLVLVHGARQQIDAKLTETGQQPRFHDERRVTDAAALEVVKQAVGASRIQIESVLSMGLANSPMDGARLRVASGNAVVARPLGVHEGVDYQFTGEVRRIDRELIASWHAANSIVLLSPLGYSATGEVFNVSSRDVAAAVATSIGAGKLVILSEQDSGELRQLSCAAAAARLADPAVAMSAAQREELAYALKAARGGVPRVQIVPSRIDGGLLLELLTRDGIGLMIHQNDYEATRPATNDDLPSLLALLEPLERQGALVRRSRELLENEIDRFIVIERDGMIIASAALYAYPEEGIGELACLAVDPAYRGDGRADQLLKAIERQARHYGLDRLFVLTTLTAHWFRERGFVNAELDELPERKRGLYNLQRNSRVLFKVL
ncbi:amino-acid N-acetyltransferase [Gammaproteobacteria bacterium]|nr:amino-acid N-acetyltransferase [Gammaproteobacteria bacterium]